ncbi:MAG: DUF5131 family protein [Clostridia bacterium]|nr:DUF5131 family protein [Clostridia bacterium]
MNKTKIEWADATWNPVTGCFHDCPYCYAARIARRFGLPYAPRLGDPGMEGACKYDTDEAGMDTMLELEKPYVRDGRKQPFPMGFYPTFHRYRLDEPQHWKKPRTIFVCSMADLFGEWVPDEWIREVMDAAMQAQQHRYLFLTKNYMRACDFRYEDNWWLGRTYTHTENALAAGASQNRNDYLCNGVARSAAPYPVWSTHKNTFLSVEPISGPVDDLGYYAHDNGYKWVIVGAETGNRSGKIIPEKEWIDRIVKDCDLRGVPVFMKDSLIQIVGEENMRREFPW